MLVLTRCRNESVFLDFSGMTDAELLDLRKAGPVQLTVVDIRGDRVRLGFDAPRSIKVNRNPASDAHH